MQSTAKVLVRPEPRKRLPRALVLHDPRPDGGDARIDWSGWYLTDEDDMGQGSEHYDIAHDMLDALRLHARACGWRGAHVGGDQFFAWIEQEPLVRVSPDVYVVDDPPNPLPDSWETWRPEHSPPRFAVEIVSWRWKKKDYEDAPAKYAQLDTTELVIFDPYVMRKRRRKGSIIQVFRRQEDDAFVCVYAGDGPVWCPEIGAAVVARMESVGPRLRVARDIEGKDIVLTTIEAVDAAERSRDAAERSRDAAERSRDAERAAREAAEREIAKLREQLKRQG